MKQGLTLVFLLVLFSKAICQPSNTIELSKYVKFVGQDTSSEKINEISYKRLSYTSEQNPLMLLMTDSTLMSQLYSIGFQKNSSYILANNIFAPILAHSQFLRDTTQFKAIIAKSILIKRNEFLYFAPLELNGIYGDSTGEKSKVEIGDNCNLYAIHINNCALNLKINEENVNQLYFSKSQLSLNANLSNSRFGFDIKFDSSNLQNTILTFLPHRESTLTFTNDTVSLYFRIEELSKIVKEISDTKIIFSDCYINTNLQVNSIDSTLHVEFQNCTFGPLATLQNLTVANISFSGCSFKSKVHFANYPSIEYSLINEGIQTGIWFSNTPLENIDFIYDDRLKLNIDTLAQPDEIRKIFESLIEKFQKEGKEFSLQRTIVEYKKYKYCHDWFLGGIMDQIDRLWWYYGFDKSRIIYWTFIFLLIFFLINLKNWENISKTYDIIPESKLNWYEQINYKRKYQNNKYILVFIFTSFVFFTFYLNFTKISYRSTKWLLLLLVEYLVGLFCLFFIVNAIFKI